MSKILSVAILGSTGYVGLELVKILLKHQNVKIVFLGTENTPNTSIHKFDNSINNKDLPLTELNKDFNYFNPKDKEETQNRDYNLIRYRAAIIVWNKNTVRLK